MNRKCIVFPVNKNKKPLCKKWKTYSGAVDTPMYGIVVPEKVCIIDIDSYKSCFNISELQEKFNEKVGADLNWNKAFLQRTLNGGCHYAFRILSDVEVKLGVNILVENIDTRVPLKSYIVSGEGYENSQKGSVLDILNNPDIFLPALPEQALNKLKKGLKEKSTASSSEQQSYPQDESYPQDKSYPQEEDAFNVALANDLKCNFTTNKIVRVVNSLPDHLAENSDDWLKIGMAIYHETSGSEKGYSIFDNFSKKAPNKYDSKINRLRWMSFKNQDKVNPITFKTVLKISNDIKKNNFASRDKNLIKKDFYYEIDNDDEDRSKAVDNNNNKKITQVQDVNEDFWKNFVFCQAHNKFIDINTFKSMSCTAFDMTYTRFTPLNSRGVNIKADVYVKDKINIIYDTEYNPLQKKLIFEKNNVKYLNTYKALKHPYIADGTTNASKSVLNHVDWLIEDEKDKVILLSFIAHQVQRSGELLRWGMIMQGVSGNGKSFFANLLKALLGSDNVGFISACQFSSKFNSWATGNIVTVIEELKVSSSENKFDVVNHIKPLLTNESITIEGKGKDSKVVTNVTNYFATSNYENCIPIDPDDRRWVAIFTKNVCMQQFRKDNPNYFIDLFKTIKENAAELYDFFKNYKIPDWFYTDFDALCNTKSKKRLIESNITIPEYIFLLALDEFEDGKHISKGKFINITYLNSKISDYNKTGDTTYEDFPKYRFLTQLLKKYGYNTVTRPRVENYANSNKSKQCVVYNNNKV